MRLLKPARGRRDSHQPRQCRNQCRRRKTVLQGDEFAAINNGTIAAKEKLLSPPKLPRADFIRSDTGIVARKRKPSFRWQNTENVPIAKYHLQVSVVAVFRRRFDGRRARYFERCGLYIRQILRPEFITGAFARPPHPVKRAIGASRKNLRLLKTRRIKRLTQMGRGLKIWAEIFTGFTAEHNPVRPFAVRDANTFAAADGSFVLQISSSVRETRVDISDDKGNRGGFVISLRNGNVLRKY